MRPAGSACCPWLRPSAARGLTHQLPAKAITTKTGTLVDATVQDMPRKGVERLADALLPAISDMRLDIEDVVAEGEKVLARLTIHSTHRASCSASR